MVDSTQRRQTGTLQHPQSGAALGREASVVAGTSRGMWFAGTERLELENSAITALAASTDGLWAIVDRKAVWHRDLNHAWHQSAAVDNLQLNCILPVGETVLIGTSEAHLMQLDQGNLQRIDRFEQADGRDEWYTPWGGLPDVRSLALGTAGELYVNIHVGGILRSRDQGQSWQPTLDLHVDVHEVRTLTEHPGLVVAATAQGLAISRDGGDSWSFDRANLHATYARAIAVAADQVVMSVSRGPQGGKAALYRCPLDSSGSFEKCDRGLPEWFTSNIDTGCLVASGPQVAFGTHEGEIFHSVDAGLTWERIASGLAPIQCLSLSRS